MSVPFMLLALDAEFQGYSLLSFKTEDRGNILGVQIHYLLLVDLDNLVTYPALALPHAWS